MKILIIVVMIVAFYAGILVFADKMSNMSLRACETYSNTQLSHVPARCAAYYGHEINSLSPQK